MCAIFGICGAYGYEEAKKAFETLSHRGVDASYIFSDENSFFGLHRLAVTHIEDAPVFSPSQDVQILFNGEIYNYATLAKTLGVEARSELEVLYAAYVKWGDAFVTHLRGMFAIVVIEKETVKLFRDPFGKKPIFYTQQQQQFIFASEMKAIHALVPLAFERRMIPQYLSFQAPLSPNTFDKHICGVDAGEMVTYTIATREIHKQTYAQCVLRAPTLRHKKTAEAALEKVLLESVALRVPEEVPFACLLSGGLDSSLVSAMASLGQQVHTFCIGYEGYENHDERPFAKRVAKHIGSVHHEVLFNKEQFLQTIDALVATLDEPLADPAMIPLYYLMQEVRKEGFKVVLTGDGSDELFMGYRTYKEFYDLEQIKALKYKGWPEQYFKSHFSMHKEWEWYKRVFEGSMVFRSSAEIFTDLQQNRLLRMNIKDNASAQALEVYAQAFAKSAQTDAPQWYSFLDLKVMLGNVFLRKLDRMSMAHGIEARSPFMDDEVAALAFSCAPQLRMADLPKGLVKGVAKKYLPEQIINRKKKGFNYPYLEWLEQSGELEVIWRVQARMKLFHESELVMYLQKAKQGMFQQHIFSLYMLCRWLEHKGF